MGHGRELLSIADFMKLLKVNAKSKKQGSFALGLSQEVISLALPGNFF
jgi:hypothetical protein